MIIKTHKTKEFLTLGNSTARDRRLELDESGFLVHCLSYSDEMDFDVKELMKLFGIGRERLLRITNNLKKLGYLALTPNQTIAGFFDGYDWHFFDVSQNVDFRDKESTREFFNRDTAYPNAGSPELRFNRTAGNPNAFKKKNGFKGKKQLKLTDKKRTDGGKEKTDAPPPEFLIFAKLCFGFPPDKTDFLSVKQAGKIFDELNRFAEAEIDMKELIFFSDYWKNSWRSIDRKFNTFQRPRPEQIFELYFEFLESADLTAARLDFEKNYEQNKKSKLDKFAAADEYDYSEFANIYFGK